MNRREMLGAALGLAAAAPIVAHAARPTITGARVYVIDGQSNAVGWGIGDFTWKSQTTKDYLIKQVGRYGSDNMQIIPMTGEPLHFWENNQLSHPRHGFGVTLVRHILSHQAPDHIAIIVPIAHNGISVLHQLGEIPPLDDAPDWWGDSCARIDLALSYAGNTYIDGWFSQQIELDAGWVANTAAPYHAQMSSADDFAAAKQRYINMIRTRYGTMKFVMGHATDAWTTQSGIYVEDAKVACEAALDAVAAANPLCATVDTSGLASSSDNTVHFSAQAAETLAGRQYAAWLTL